MTQNLQYSQTTAPSAPTAPGPAALGLPVLGAVLGLGTAALGGTVLAADQLPEWAAGLDLFAGPADALLRSWVSREATAGVAAVTGAVAAGLGMAGAGRGRGEARRLPALSAGAVAVTAGLGLLGMTAIMAIGYALALSLPLLIVGAVLVGLVTGVTSTARQSGRRPRVLAPAASLAVLSTGVLAAVLLQPGPEAVNQWASLVGRVAAQIGPLLWLLAMAGTWTALALRWSRADVSRPGRWVRRHRRGLAVAAAFGPAPYILARLTWLTPWPVLGPIDGLSAEAVTIGLLLGSSALVGSVLTLGLALPWGERFPRWLPALGGRAVPVPLAVVPGAGVAAALCAAATPMPLAFATDSIRMLLVSTAALPFWAWGPLLALAVWGYALHRRPIDAAARTRLAA